MSLLENQLSRHVDPAPNWLFATLLTITGLATLAVGYFWMMEKPKALPRPSAEMPEEFRRMFPDAPSRDSPEYPEVFGVLLIVDMGLGLSWWAMRRFRKDRSGRLHRRGPDDRPKSRRGRKPKGP